MLSSNFCHMFKNLDFVSKVYLHICFIAVMASLKCITHYILQDASYSKIKQVSEVNWERIQAAKAIREAKGGANYHKQQCDSVPDHIDPLVHGIHLEPCYKKFVLILSQERKDPEASLVEGTSSRSSLRRQRSQSTPNMSNVFPKECNFCKKWRVKRKQTIATPITITTKMAEERIKQAAESKDEELFFAIKDMDLIAKEFKYHDFCYKDFTRKETSSEKQKQVASTQGNFDAVVACIEDRVIAQNEAISIAAIHEIFGVHPKDTRYRSKLKSKLQSKFRDQLLFLHVDGKTPEVVINSECIKAHTMVKNRDLIIKEAADFLREDIQTYASNLPELSWPPCIEELNVETRQPPVSVTSFLSQLLKTKDNAEGSTVERLVQSYASHLIHGVTRGKVTTAKHFLLGLGLHSITGQKKPIQILNHLGHCMEYNLTCEIETAHAEATQSLSEISGTLPLKPKSEKHTILTVFWADNFDMNLKTATGHGAVHSTHMVAFQEESKFSEIKHHRLKLARTKKRHVEDKREGSVDIHINPRKEPSPLSQISKTQEDLPRLSFQLLYLAWMVLRNVNSGDQVIPSLFAWKMKLRSVGLPQESIKKTVTTYLPPVNAKVTDFSTIYSYLLYMQQLADEANMPYVNVTLDVGAAMNAFKVVWNYPKKFGNVIIHLGDFHFIKENFGIIGKLVTGSGFEDVVFQAGVCSSGSLKGVLAGSHYNRAWIVHAAFSEALERLLFERFLNESNLTLPDVFFEPIDVPSLNNINEAIESAKDIFTKYLTFKDNARNGALGKTPQFWIQLYMDLMECQTRIHLSVQENDFVSRHAAWKTFLPMFFALNKPNYARCASHYVGILDNIDELHPGLKELLSKEGLSIQAQDRYPLRTAVDQRGEQTLNRDAKTAGGIKSFASDSKSILKWTLNRSEQAKNTSELLNMADIKSPEDIYKSLRLSQVLKSESFTDKIVKTLREEYTNPFGSDLDRSLLYNLSSGVPVDETLCNGILNIRKVGETLQETFAQERLVKSEVPFHEPIKRQKLVLFDSSLKKATVTRNNVVKTVEVNRHLGKIARDISKERKDYRFRASLGVSPLHCAP